MSANGHGQPSANVYSQSLVLNNDAIANLLGALEVIHDPRSANETRQKATEFLEAQKQDEAAAYNGFLLASNSQQPAVVRHFGCSLLEHSIRYKWQDFETNQRTAVRQWIVDLTYGLTEQDAHYLRNKVAYMWVELAKQSWGADWLDMDATLLDLWERGEVYIEVVLTILEALSEDVFYREDATAALRGTELSGALVEIFTPSRRSANDELKTVQTAGLKANADGWLWRISQLLLPSGNGPVQGPRLRTNVICALATLRSVFSWIMLPAVVSTSCFESICRLLANQTDTELLLAAVESLHALYTRSHLAEREFKALVWPLYEPTNVGMLTRLYEWSLVDAQEIDETKYSFSKKFSELISFLCGHIEEQPEALLRELDISVFFRFTIDILRHPSLFVSIPILHAWTKLLASPTIGDSAPVWSVMEYLLGTACQRIIKYEALPEDSEEPAIIFLNEDISTVPERHAFLGNYRRFCHNIVEIISQRRPLEALQYIVSQADTEVGRFATQDEAFDPRTFQRDTLTILHVDAHFTVVEAAVRGFSKWVSVHGKDPQEDEQKRVTIESTLDEWASALLSRTFGNPLMKQRVIKLAIELATRGIEQNQGFALRVLEHILVSQPSDRPEYPAYSDAVKELHVFSSNELRKLGMRNVNYFATFYDQLEAKVNDILRTTNLEEKPQTELTGLLLIIMQRASNVAVETRWKKLMSFVDPITTSWQSSELTNALSSFESFCKLLDIDRVGEYMQRRNASHIDDWSSTLLDADGLQLQADMTAHFQQAIPLRASKTILAVSTENLKINSEPYKIACEMWRDRIPAILPNVLALIKHAHTFSSMSTWSGYPAELQQIFRRILTDRFWQAGISVGTKDQFYAKITSTKATLEGFASSVRGKLRSIRETCYSILFCLSRLGENFYGYEQLAQPLAEALFGTAGCLSSHQFSVLLNMSRYLIDDCPIQYRDAFLPPLISTLFTQLDQNISTEWSRILEKRSNNAAADDLTEEMKEESVLRQFTYNAIMLVTSILDPNRDDSKGYTSSHHSTGHQRRRSSLSHPERAASEAAKTPTLLRTFVLCNPTILEPILLFCTHALRVQDARCASIITRVIRSIVPTFSQPASLTGVSPEVAEIIREFISSSVLREAITSLHDPYFVELQKDLAQLIATIWICYGIPHENGGQSLSPTPQAVIQSLPGITQDRVERVADRLAKTASSRQQRAYILDLLETLRGLSINEMGKINRTRGKDQSMVQKRYTGTSSSGDMEGIDQSKPVNVDDGPDLEGIAEIFG